MGYLPFCKQFRTQPYAHQEAHNLRHRAFAGCTDDMGQNMADNPAESISEGSTGTPAGLEKELPTEERIPTH